MNAHHPALGDRQTLQVRPKKQMVQHNCDQGHIWFALMRSPSMFSTRAKWIYCNASDQFCPKCGTPQSEEELI